jgi:hypothetical protein
MHRLVIIAIVAGSLFLSVGCARMRTAMGMNSPEQAQANLVQKPAPAEEMAMLQPLVGDWEESAEMITPDPQRWKQYIPGGRDVPETFRGHSTFKWDFDGMALRNEGWHEMLNLEKNQWVEYWTWDPKARKFRTSFLSNWGHNGTGWAEVDPDGKTFHMHGQTYNARGQRSKYNGMMRLQDDNSMSFDITEQGPRGKARYKGTSKRVRQS